MKNAFGILESLVALALFSLVILLCSKTLLQIQKDLKIYKDYVQMRSTLSNAISLIQKRLAYSFVDSSAADELVLYEISKEFFSNSYHPAIQKCGVSKIVWKQNPKFFANFSPMFEIVPVVGRQGDFLLLERELKCGALIPINQKIRFKLQENGDLYFNGEILVQRIRLFEFKEQSNLYHLQICSEFCESAIFPKSEIFYAF